MKRENEGERGLNETGNEMYMGMKCVYFISCRSLFFFPFSLSLSQFLSSGREKKKEEKERIESNTMKFLRYSQSPFPTLSGSLRKREREGEKGRHFSREYYFALCNGCEYCVFRMYQEHNIPSFFPESSFFHSLRESLSFFLSVSRKGPRERERMDKKQRVRGRGLERTLREKERERESSVSNLLFYPWVCY